MDSMILSQALSVVVVAGTLAAWRIISRLAGEAREADRRHRLWMETNRVERDKTRTQTSPATRDERLERALQDRWNKEDS